MATITHAGTAVWTTTAGNKTVPAASGFAVAVGDLIVVVAPATGVATSVVTDDNPDGLGTYTQVDSDRTGWSTTGHLSVWVRNALIGSATNTTWTLTQTASTGGGGDIFRVAGMTQVGAAAVRSSGGQSTGTGGTTPAPVLSLTPSTFNPIITAVCNGTSPGGVTGPASYTAPTDLGYATPTSGLDTAFINSGITNATITWGGNSATAFGSVAIELDTGGPAGPALGWSGPAGNRVIPLRAGSCLGSSGGPVSNLPPTGPPFFPRSYPVRARNPLPRRGRISSSPGAPVHNPTQGPPASWSGPAGLRAVLLRTGTMASTQLRKAQAAPPPVGPAFHPATQPVKAKLPVPFLKGRIASSSPGAPVRNPSAGPVFRQKAFPVQARNPLPPKGRVYGISRSTVSAPLPPLTGPVFRQATSPAQARLPLPRRGVCRAIRFGPLPVNPGTGPQFFPQHYPIQATDPLSRKGRVYSSPGAPVQIPPVIVSAPQPLTQPVGNRVVFLRTGHAQASATAAVQNPSIGPAFFPVNRALRARLPVPLLKGRTGGNPGGPVQNPVTPAIGPRFFPRTSPVRARPSLPLAGQVSGMSGPPPQNPTKGPVFRQATSPVRARIIPPPPPRRIVASKGAPVVNPAPPTTGPVFRPRNFVKAQLPLPRRGVCRAIRFGPLPGNPTQGPSFEQATSPVQARLPLSRRGRVSSNPGILAGISPPGTGPVFFPRPYPVQAQEPLPKHGRVYGISKGAPVVNPGAGPVFRQKPYPVQAADPLPRRGRIYSNPGGPVNNPVPGVIGPPFYPRRDPARIRITLPPRGRISGNIGAPVRNPSTGPQFRQLTHPVTARLPLPPRGRVSSNAGIPVIPPNTGPKFIQSPRPVQARFPLPPKGRVYGNPGGPLFTSGPVFRQAVHPAQARIPQTFSKGRVYSNPGAPVQNPPTSGPRFVQRHDPARIRPSLPPRGRVYSNKGAPVHNPGTGPRFIQAVHPIRVVIPQNAPRGRISSNPGGPVANIPFSTLRFATGAPYFRWNTDDIEFRWTTGNPETLE